MLDLQEATTINSDYPEATSTVFPLPLPAFDDTRQSCARNQNSRMPTLRAVVEAYPERIKKCATAGEQSTWTNPPQYSLPSSSAGEA